MVYQRRFPALGRRPRKFETEGRCKLLVDSGVSGENRCNLLPCCEVCPILAVSKGGVEAYQIRQYNHGLEELFSSRDTRR